MNRFSIKVEVSDGNRATFRTLELRADGRRTVDTLADAVVRALKDKSTSWIEWPESEGTSFGPKGPRK